MSLYTPGSFIHHRPSRLGQPMWPAVVCTDDVAPAEFLRTRPPGYVTLVLRVGESFDLRWALSSEMHEYDPFVPFEEEDMVGRTPGLGEAYAVANSALEAGLGLDHWRNQFQNSLMIIPSHDDKETVSGEEEEGFDQDLRTALRLSRQECHGRRPQGYCSSLLPPFKQSQQDNVTKAPRNDSTRTKKLFQPPLIRKESHSPKSSMSPRHRNQLQTPPSSCSDHETSSSQIPEIRFEDLGNGPRHPLEAANSPSKFNLNAGSNDLLSWGRLGQASCVPTSDVVEGRLSASKAFVLIYFGPGREERLLPLNSIWNKPYFRDPRSGKNFFELNSDGVWELNHPELSKIELEEVDLVVEFLESNSFGYIHPQGEEERQDCFVQITSASRAAEKLGMTDLMEHIVEKLERLAPWDLWNTMCFACLAYAWPSPHFLAQERLKDLLATEIAQNFWIYIEDEHLSTTFIQRLKDLPELERDINARRQVALNTRLNSEDEGENEHEDEEENENFDLYED